MALNRMSSIVNFTNNDIFSRSSSFIFSLKVTLVYFSFKIQQKNIIVRKENSSDIVLIWASLSLHFDDSLFIYILPISSLD